MTEIKSVLTPDNLIKGAIFYATIVGGYYNLRQEIRDNRVNYLSDKAIFEYRLTQVERCKGVRQMEGERFATIPEKPERKDYEQE